MYPAQWYLFQPRQNNTHLSLLSDDRRQTCVVLENGSHLLKATLARPYNSLEVGVRIAQPLVNFDKTHSNCTRIPSQLLTHDSSGPIATGRTCDPFCQVPGTCELRETKDKSNGRIMYTFLCQCTVTSCNDLLLSLRPEIDRHTFELCDVSFWTLRIHVWPHDFYVIGLALVTVLQNENFRS